MPDHPFLTVADAGSWAAWLEKEGDISNGVMLTLVKTGTKEPTTLTYEEARDEALCQGWIDSTGFKRDDGTHVRRFTPRRARSLWSKHNINHVARLENEGRMRERGWSEINKAKADGRWDAAYCQSNNEVPADLLEAIANNPAAQAQWDILTKTNRFAICFRLSALKVAANRPKRIQHYVDMLARGETIHPQARTLEKDAANTTRSVKASKVTKVTKKSTKPVKSRATEKVAKPIKVVPRKPGQRQSARIKELGTKVDEEYET